MSATPVDGYREDLRTAGFSSVKQTGRGGSAIRRRVRVRRSARSGAPCPPARQGGRDRGTSDVARAALLSLHMCPVQPQRDLADDTADATVAWLAGVLDVALAPVALAFSKNTGGTHQTTRISATQSTDTQNTPTP